MNLIPSNNDIDTINDVKLFKENNRVIVTGNSYPIKDIMKNHGAKWDADKKKWYYTDNNPDLSHLLKDKNTFICCPFAFNINYDEKITECSIKCKKYIEIQNEKQYRENRIKEYNEDLMKQIEEDTDKYIVIYHLRNWGETNEYGTKFNTLEEAEQEYESKIIHKGKRKYTPFNYTGTLYGIDIIHNNIIIKGGYYNKSVGDEFNMLYNPRSFK